MVMPRAHILIIDDEARIRSSLAGILADEGYETSMAADGEAALSKIQSDPPPDLVLSDIWMPKLDGLELLKKIREADLDVPVIMISGHGNIETAVKAIKMGAFDFLEKPLSLEKTVLIVKHALDQRRLEAENKTLRMRIDRKYEIIGQSTMLSELRKQVQIAAPTNGRVLIYGENGTGKELIAREIHEKSKRGDKPFVGVNCAAIPEDLIESELFGHEKGAFTGATSLRQGKFELADGGTLFLDEVGDMSLKTQAKLLRVLEEEAVQRVGGGEPIKVDVRVIAASNKNLKDEIEHGNFREDLYYRLSVIPIKVPSLKERKEDVPTLVDHFLREFCAENGKKLKKITSEALDLMARYDWPGNVRELKNLIERLVIMVPGNTITSMDIPLSLREKSQPSLREAKQEFEKYFITQILRANRGNISKSAKILKIDRSLLYQKLKIYGLEPKTESQDHKDYKDYKDHKNHKDYKDRKDGSCDNHQRKVYDEFI
jgi:two-component system nitrogen regulation response regulator NtrX